MLTPLGKADMARRRLLRVDGRGSFWRYHLLVRFEQKGNRGYTPKKLFQGLTDPVRVYLEHILKRLESDGIVSWSVPWKLN